MTPADYDAWYDTPRGRWIGDTEWRLLARLLAPVPGETLLDVGCGTGWFTRRFAAAGLVVTGVDLDAASLDWARRHSDAAIRFERADARRLPFPDASFDCVASVTALCFVDDWEQAVAEMLRVCRRRVVIGTLNRHSLLWRRKGRDGGRGAYAGARWQTRTELDRALRVAGAARVRHASAVYLPGGDGFARLAERVVPSRVPLGAFIAAVARPGTMRPPTWPAARAS